MLPPELPLKQTSVNINIGPERSREYTQLCAFYIEPTNTECQGTSSQHHRIEWVKPTATSLQLDVLLQSRVELHGH
jgi:hypothetical protein